MKWLGIMLLAALLAVAPGSGGAAPPEAKGKTPGSQPQGLETKGAEAPKSGTRFSLEEKKAYQKKTAAALAELQDKISALYGKMAQVPPPKRPRLRRDLISLRKMAIAARSRLADLETAPAQDWSRLKADLDKAMTELQKMYGAVEARL